MKIGISDARRAYACLRGADRMEARALHVTDAWRAYVVISRADWMEARA
jgi:hypothetical protein